MFTNRFVIITATLVVAITGTVTADGEDTPAHAVPVEFFPLPVNTTFERHMVGEGVTPTATGERLIYSNTLGKFKNAPGAGNLVSDDISTIVPGGCKLRRYEIPVLGIVNPANPVRGKYTVSLALYSSCPGSVPLASQPALIIPNTKAVITFNDQCRNAVDDDGDATVNDGCPAIGPAEAGAQCLNATDDDGDTRVNDGCPAVGPAEIEPDLPRLISFVPPEDAPLPTNFWLGFKFDRNNAGVVFGTPPMVGFSCDQYDYPGSPCTSWAGGFPRQPHASFNLQIFADADCPEAFAGYKNNNPSGPTYNPGADKTVADDIQLGVNECQMIAYEVAVKGAGFYTFDLRDLCDGGVIPGTEKTFTVLGTTEPQIARFTFNTPIVVPNYFFLSAKISAPSGGVVVSGQQACIGQTADSFQVAGVTGCNPTVYPPPPSEFPRAHAAFSAAITCAGPAPVGTCCDMYIPECQGGPNTDRTCMANMDCNYCSGGTLNGSRCDPFIPAEDNPCNQGGGICPVQGTCESTCREVPEVNCPFPPRFLPLRPEWVQGAACTPDPFPLPCGVAACCRPDQVCENLTANECNAVAPIERPRQWQTGQYCDQNGQSCPWMACLARTGECTLPRCTPACFGRTCAVGPECCDSCPPVGCEDPECCTNVCNQDAFCCETEWDQLCADKVRTGTHVVDGVLVPICDLRPSNDVCAPQARLEGARLMTDVPPSSAESDSGRASVDATDPGFGCHLNNPGAKGLQTVWYKFVATHTTALLQTCNSDSPANDSLLSVYAVGDPSTPQTQCSSLIPAGRSDDLASCGGGGKNSKLCVKSLIPGNLYYVLVASKVALADGKAYQLDISAPCTEPVEGTINNYCPGAVPISDGITAFNLGGTCPASCPETLDVPKLACIPTMTIDEWYKYTATCSGQLTVDTCGSTPGVGPDTNLAIYDGDVCPQLIGSAAPIACSADFGSNCGQGGLGSKIVVDAVQGQIYKIRLADSIGNLPSGNLKVGCVQASCPAGEMTSINPPDGVVDAGRPHDPNDAGSLEGIQTIIATGPHDAQLSCFTLCDTANPVPANSISSRVENPIGTYTINLARPITAGALTTITYTDFRGMKSSGRFSSSPANVNDDLLALALPLPPYPSDVQYLLDALNGVAALPWGNYSSDLNRSNLFTPADLLEVIDLLEGNGAYEPWDFTFNPSENFDCPPP